MTLLFGSLTEDFVNFAMTIEQANSGNSDAQAQVPSAAARFRSGAAKDSTWLVCIGEPNLNLFVFL